MTPPTPLYDGLLAEALGRARASERAASLAFAASLLHAAAPTGRCTGCGLPAPCPTTRLLIGEVSVDAAVGDARRLLVARALAEAAVLPATAPPQAHRVEPADSDSDSDSDSELDNDSDSDSDSELDNDIAGPPAMPSAEDIFAPNPAFGRALSVLLGG